MSIWEILITILVALLVLGPKQIPQLATGLGRTLGFIRNLFADIQSEIDNQAKQQQLKSNQQKAKRRQHD